MPRCGTRAGSQLSVSSLDLPLRRSASWCARCSEDDTRAPVAALTGTRAALARRPASRAEPGAAHDDRAQRLDCALEPPLPPPRFRRLPDVGHRDAGWSATGPSVLRALARPASYERQLDAGWTGRRELVVGRSAARPDPDCPRRARAAGSRPRGGVEAVASFCRSQIGLVGCVTRRGAAGKPRCAVPRGEDRRTTRSGPSPKWRRSSTLGAGRSCSCATSATLPARCSRTRARQESRGFSLSADASMRGHHPLARARRRAAAWSPTSKRPRRRGAPAAL